MRGLIGDLLDAGRIDSGTLSINPEPSELSALVDRARNTFLSGGGRHAILIDLPPDLPRVMSDRRRIVQVLNNLFINAARHSPDSCPIRVEAVRDGVHVAISVVDKGRGVAAELLPHLFRKHARAGEEDAAVHHGLGLAICKGAGGGAWRAHPRGERWRRARGALHLHASGDGGGSGCRPRIFGGVSGGRERTRILVVDDDPRTLRFVRNALSRAGYAPIVTGDPLDLAHLVRTERPGLVLLDLMLPGTDGIEIMEQIEELGDLPVIFISGYSRDETIARALEVERPTTS